MFRLSAAEAKPHKSHRSRTAAALLAGILAAAGCTTNGNGAPSDTPPTFTESAPTSDNDPVTTTSVAHTLPESSSPMPTSLPSNETSGNATAGSVSNTNSNTGVAAYNSSMQFTFSDLDNRVAYGVGVYDDITSPAEASEAVEFYDDKETVQVVCRAVGREVDSHEELGDAPRDASNIWLKIAGVDQYATVIYSTIAGPATDPQIAALQDC